MPYDATGRWEPRQGWIRWMNTFTDMIEANVTAACQFAVTCREMGFDPTAKAVRWWFDVCGVKEKELRARNNMAFWPRYLTAKDWDSLALYAANDAAVERKRAAKSISPSATTGTGAGGSAAG